MWRDSSVIPGVSKKILVYRSEKNHRRMYYNFFVSCQKRNKISSNKSKYASIASIFKKYSLMFAIIIKADVDQIFACLLLN